jgi:hypothetical protein
MTLTEELQRSNTALTKALTMRKDKQDELDTLDQSISALRERILRLQGRWDEPSPAAQAVLDDPSVLDEI